MPNSNDQLSPQVILRPATGRLKQKGAVVAANLEAILPAPEAANRVLGFFQQAGFECGPLVANSFSITGPRSLLRKHFTAGDISQHETAGGELALGGLPAGIRDLVEAIAFTAPPDFGPTSYF